MTLRAQSSELRAARSTLQALADDTAVADTYKSDFMQIDGGDTGALFLHIDNVNRNVVQRLDDVLSRLKQVLHESGVELGAVATWYDDADESAEQRADQQIPLVADVPANAGFDDTPEVPDTVPSDPGDYEPPEDQPEPPPGDDDEIIMAPGPLGVPGEPPSGTGVVA
jgi:hypothetical protein